MGANNAIGEKVRNGGAALILLLHKKTNLTAENPPPNKFVGVLPSGPGAGVGRFSSGFFAFDFALLSLRSARAPKRDRNTQLALAAVETFRIMVVVKRVLCFG